MLLAPLLVNCGLVVARARFAARGLDSGGGRAAAAGNPASVVWIRHWLVVVVGQTHTGVRVELIRICNAIGSGRRGGRFDPARSRLLSLSHGLIGCLLALEVRGRIIDSRHFAQLRGRHRLLAAQIVLVRFLCVFNRVPKLVLALDALADLERPAEQHAALGEIIGDGARVGCIDQRSGRVEIIRTVARFSERQRLLEQVARVKQLAHMELERRPAVVYAQTEGDNVLVVALLGLCDGALVGRVRLLVVADALVEQPAILVVDLCEQRVPCGLRHLAVLIQHHLQAARQLMQSRVQTDSALTLSALSSVALTSLMSFCCWLVSVVHSC